MNLFRQKNLRLKITKSFEWVAERIRELSIEKGWLDRDKKYSILDNRNVVIKTSECKDV